MSNESVVLDEREALKEKLLAEIDRFVVRYEKTFDVAVPLRIVSQQFGKRVRKAGFELRELVCNSDRFNAGLNKEGGTLLSSVAVMLEEVAKEEAALAERKARASIPSTDD